MIRNIRFIYQIICYSKLRLYAKLSSKPPLLASLFGSLNSKGVGTLNTAWKYVNSRV